MNDDRFRRAFALSGGIPKPEPIKRARIRKRKAVVQVEKKRKAGVRSRDKFRCRWPSCSAWNEPIEVAHLEHKGMGGDKKSLRTEQQKMITLCRMHHQLLDGRDVNPDFRSYEIEPVFVDLGTDGPCRFWLTGADGSRILAGQESFDQSIVEAWRNG